MQTLDTTQTTDGMQTIIYQGQPVQATLVNYLSGTIPTSTVDADGDEELFRDEAGRYYLRRTLNLLADHHENDGEGNIPASGRTHVHRINVNAAILWATTRLNSETLNLRQDAADLLMENRSYFDPNPTHLTPAQRELARTAVTQGKTTLTPPALNTTRRFADGSVAVTVLFKPEAAKLLDAGCKIDRKTPLQWVYDSATGDLVATLRENFPGWSAREEHELQAVFDASDPEAAAPVAATSGRIVVELDEVASTMLRQVCREGNSCREAGEDPRDLVNAAVTFYLSDDGTARCGEFNLEDGGEALERAKTDRLSREEAA